MKSVACMITSSHVGVRVTMHMDKMIKWLGHDTLVAVIQLNNRVDPVRGRVKVQWASHIKPNLNLQDKNTI